MAKASTGASGRITQAKIRMYCLGTGDCFVIKFFSGSKEKFTMMIDCGSCQGGKKEFEPYLQDLYDYVNGTIDLLVITHEHNDHVNGFAKCPEIFEAMTIKKAWFAWTEHPDDPGGKAKDLQNKKKKMRMAFANAFAANQQGWQQLNKDYAGDYNRHNILESHNTFMEGMQTLADINLPASGSAGAPLPGLKKIKAILKSKKTKIEYLEPGSTETVTGLPGLKFHVLGPPYETEAVYRDGKEGKDVYKKKLALSEFSLAANAFLNMENDAESKDIPFADEYVISGNDVSILTSIAMSKNRFEQKSEPVIEAYNKKGDEWRKIELDWLNSAGSLALRLNSHINNTSLVLAVESEGPGKKSNAVAGRC